MSRLVKDGQLQNEAVARQLTVAQAKEAGLEDPIAIAKYVEDNYLDNFSQDHSGVMERALDEAREATLQTPLEPVDDAWRKRNPDAGLGTASNGLAGPRSRAHRGVLSKAAARAFRYLRPSPERK